MPLSPRPPKRTCPAGPGAPTSLSRADIRIPVTTSIGSVRTFGFDKGTFNADGQRSKGDVYWAPRYHPHHGPGVQDYGSNSGLPLACKGRPGGG